MRAGLCAAILFVSAGAQSDEAWITDADYDGLHIVVRGEEDDPDTIAARRFRIRWNDLTGFEPTVSFEPKPDTVQVWIGDAARAEFPELFGEDSVSEEGFLIRTLRDESGAHLILAGGGPRGTLYAEWEFLERFMGARSFDIDGFVWPESPPKEIPFIDYRWEPPFAYRDSNFSAFLNAPWFTSINRLNGQWTALPDRLGGHIGFVHGLRGHGHTFHDFVHPDEYFDTHPEYFAEIEGERIKWSQLCLTNPDVLAITIERAREFLQSAAPNERILSVSQMDYPGFASWCTCAECGAVDEAEGSHSGTIVRFVNAVAAALESDFPDALIETFAYMHSRKPPARTRPRDNVLIRVCAIEADYGRPLRDRRSDANRAFVRDLKTWRRITNHVYVWDYTQNWWAFQAPHPNVHVLQPNLAFYKRVGVDGVFEQASPYASNSDVEPLKTYLFGRGLRDPNFDWRTAYGEFLDHYYGPAAPQIDEYRELLHERLRSSRMPLWFYNDLSWLDAGTVEQAQNIFESAFGVVDDDSIYAEHLAAANVPVQFAALVCPPRVYQEPDAYVFTRPASQTLHEYVGTLESRGVQFLNDYPLALLSQRMHGRTPPRFERAPIETLRSESAELWVVPARSGAVVRWREDNTGHDWLRGYDDIRHPFGRIQDWANTGPYPTARPYPVDQPYELIDRTDDAVEVGTQLDNGLFVRRRMTLTDTGLDVFVEVTNVSDEAIKPKYGVGAEISERDLLKPAVWSEVDGAWSRERWTVDRETETQLWKVGQGVDRWGLRLADLSRTVVITPLGGSIGRQSVEREPNGDSSTILIEMDSTPLEAGASREMTFSIGTLEAAPRRMRD